MPRPPDPEGFAKAVLWHIAGLRAEIWGLKNRVLRYEASHNGKTLKQIEDEWEEEVGKNHVDLYEEALEQARLEDEPPKADPPGEEPRA